MTEKQSAILAVLGLSVICVFCDLAFRLMGGAAPSLQTPTLQFDHTTPIHEVATEAPDVPISVPKPVDALEPKELEELTPLAPLPEKPTPPAPLPEKLTPPSHGPENLYTPLPGE